jgi:hypothetical protein
MKKLVLCAFMAAMLPASLFALDLSAGVKGGVGIDVFNGKDWQDILDASGETNGLKLGLSASIFLNIGITKSLSIQLEAGYSLLGGKAVDKYADFYSRYSMNAVEIPVFLMPRFALGSGKLIVFAGPDLIAVIGDMKEVDYQSGDIDGEGSITLNQTPLLGVAGGIGYIFPLRSGSLVVDAKYAQALTEMFTDTKMFAGGLLVRIGYAFKL